MASESTPLLAGRAASQNRRRFLVRRPRSGPTIFARWVLVGCGSVVLLVGLTLTFLAVLLLCPMGAEHRSILDTIKSGFCREYVSKVSHAELQNILLDTPSTKKSEEWSRYYTAGPHLAGKNLSQVRLCFCLSPV